MRSSSRCINQLKDRCPGEKHTEIMSSLKMYVNLILFCSRDNAMEGEDDDDDDGDVVVDAAAAADDDDDDDDDEEEED